MLSLTAWFMQLVLCIEGMPSLGCFFFVIYPGEGEACNHCPIAAQFQIMVTEPSNRGGFIASACSCTLGGLGWVGSEFKLFCCCCFVCLFFLLFSICFNVKLWIMCLLSYCAEREGLDWIKLFICLFGFIFSDGHRCCLHVSVGIEYRGQHPKLCPN